MLVALDVDGTLYEDGHVPPETVAAIADAADRGHLIVIVTGRRYDDLVRIVPAELLAPVSCCICENGGVLVADAHSPLVLLASPLDPALVHALRDEGVGGLDVGFVALGAPSADLDAILRARDAAGSDRVVVINKSSATLLPPGCDKGSGLRAAVDHLGAHGVEIMAMGDAENDIPMFAMATVPVGVANADAAVRALGIPITKAPAGLGVVEAFERWLV